MTKRKYEPGVGAYVRPPSPDDLQQKALVDACVKAGIGRIQQILVENGRGQLPLSADEFAAIVIDILSAYISARTTVLDDRLDDLYASPQNVFA